MMLAWLVARENHCIQPISKPTKAPNAARVKTYGPPVVSKRLLNSAKHSATDKDSAPISTNPIGLHAPTCAATCAGQRKIAPPITWLTPIAVRSQRPSARLSVIMPAELYHDAPSDHAHHTSAPLLRRPGVLPRGARAVLFQPLDLRGTRRSDSERR